MAVVATPSSNRVTVKLNIGMSESGATLTSSQALSGIKKTAWTSADDTKAYAIANLMRAVLQYPVYSVERSSTNTLDEE